MADDGNRATSPRPLFPIEGISFTSNVSSSIRSIFPSVGAPSIDKVEKAQTSKPGAGNFDWLYNDSFEPKDALKIAHLHKERTETERESASEVEERVKQTESQLDHYDTSNNESVQDRHYVVKKRKFHSHGRFSSDETHSNFETKKRKHKKQSKKKNRHSSESSDTADHDRRRKHKKSHHKKQKKHHRKSPVIKQHIVSEPLKPETNWVEETVLKPEDAFRIDVKGDKNNRAFQSLYYLDTARYHSQHRLCLGLGKKQSIKWTDSDKVQKKKKNNSDRYYGKHAVSLLNDDNLRLLDLSKPKFESKPGGHSQSGRMTYIPLGISMVEITTVTPQQRSIYLVDPLGIHDAATQQYLQGVMQKKDISEVLEDKETETRSELIKKKTTEFNKMTHESPHDVKAWLEFVRFQDEGVKMGVFAMDDSPETEKGKKLSLAVAEKKISILENAIEKNPSSIELKVEHLELCKEFWTSSKLLEHWKQMAFLHPNDPLLWQQYLIFSQSTFSSFTFSRTMTLYGKCLSTLQSIVGGTFRSHNALPHTEDYMIDLFTQECEYMRQSGHTEKAIAAFQALIEFNCFSPAKLDESTKPTQQIAFFETFWDSGEPVFGEHGAKGWNKWMHKKEKGGWEELVLPTQEENENDEEDVEDDFIKIDRPVWKVWSDVENYREQCHWLPWKPDVKRGQTEEDCEDPDRLVLFDDISSSLFKVTTQDHQFQIILRFLQFLGVSTCPITSTACYQSQRYFGVSLEHPTQLLQNTLSTSELAWAINYRGVACIVEPLQQKVLLSECEFSCSSHSKDLNDFIINIFTQALSVLSGVARTHLTCIWLQYETRKAAQIKGKRTKHQTKSVRKFAKSVLKETHNRNNLLLWEMYAQFEWQVGNIDEARKIFDTALMMYSQLSKHTQSQDMKQSAAKLCRTYTELELGFDVLVSTPTHHVRIALDESRRKRALHILTNFADPAMYTSSSSNPVNSVSILKARSVYQMECHKLLQGYKDLVSSHSSMCVPVGSCVTHVVTCYALFQYMTVGLKAATVVFEESLSELRNQCKLPEPPEDRFTNISEYYLLDYEMLLTLYVRVHFYHMVHHPTTLTPVRNLLQRALSDFPNSPTFLYLFILMELRSHITGRVRRYFDHALHESTTPVPFLYAIFAEQLREQTFEQVQRNQVAASDTTWQLPSTGITHRIRSLFERSTSCRNARHCILIWRMYIYFEVHHGNKERAKSIFYRSLQHCPWSKALYMDAILYFPDDLLHILDIMMEKEIRIRAPLEEIEMLLKAKQQEQAGNTNQTVQAADQCGDMDQDTGHLNQDNLNKQQDTSKQQIQLITE
ncbi:nuclear exosome regulator NRDE2-like [Saccoglossus kowalevskii]